MEKKELNQKVELASNAEWILYRDADGSITAESRKDEVKQVLSVKSLKKMRSLIALIEGSGVKIE